MEYEIEVNTPGTIFEVAVSLAAPQNQSPERGFSVIAGINLSGGRVVSVKEGKAVYFDPNDVDFYGSGIGITKTSAMEGSLVEIQMNGVFYESGLGLDPDSLYYVGPEGNLTKDPTGLKIVQPLGVAIDSNHLKINITSSIETI